MDDADLPRPPAVPPLRAADVDRDRVAQRLGQAYAEGRLDGEEYQERLDAAYRARTHADLEPLVADLPSVPGELTVRPSQVPVVPGPPSDSVVAVFASTERAGVWSVAERLTAVAVFGESKLDMTQATFAAREVECTTNAIFGSVVITVPAGVRVVNGCTAVLGEARVPPEVALPADAPVLRLTGLALFGSIVVSRA
jgi:hypothetical protein